MLNVETVNKIAKRIKESKRFDEKFIAKRIKESKRFDEKFIENRIYFFDDSLTIERYNGLYKIEFKNQTLGHLHGRGDDEKLHDVIYYAIEDKKKELKNKAFQEL